MNTRSDRFWQPVLAAALIVAVGPTTARADGSIRFNGSTSKVERTGGDVLAGQGNITVCMWINAVGTPTSNTYLLFLDEAGSALQLLQTTSANTLSWVAGFTGMGGNGVWTFEVKDGSWNAVALTHAKSDPASDPVIRVNFVELTPNQTGTPSMGATPYPTNEGYSVGTSWSGKIAHVQVFNRILNADEMDACLQAPGSVTEGLRLWLPMTNAADIKDRSTLGFDGTGTALTTDVSGPMITGQPGVLAGVTILSHGVTNKTQHEIPRYANGVTYPGGQLRGAGPASVIRGTAATDDQTVKAVVITQDYGVNTAQFQSDSASTKAVLQAAVRDVTIAGHDDTGNNYESSSTALVHNEPADFNRITGRITNTSGNGVAPIYITSANHGLQEGDVVVISGVAGNTAANGTFVVYDVINATTFLIDAYGNGAYAGGGVWTTQSNWQDKYDGLLMRSSGLLVENVNFFYIPGTALVVKKGGTGGHTGPFLTFDREKTRIWDCKVNRAYRGFIIHDIDAIVGRLEGTDLRDFGIKLGNGSGTGAIHIDGALSFHRVGVDGVDQPAVWFPEGSGGCWGGPLNVSESPRGVFMDSSANVIGPITAKDCTVANIDIQGERNTIGPVELEVDASAVGVLIYDQFVKILGGTITMTDTSALGVSIKGGSGSGIVIRDVAFFGASSSLGTAITTDIVLNNCTIEAHFEDVGTGIDLSPGSADYLGINNTIRITTENVGTAINLDSTWDDVNNRIWINGVEQEDN